MQIFRKSVVPAIVITAMIVGSGTAFAQGADGAAGGGTGGGGVSGALGGLLSGALDLVTGLLSGLGI